MAVAITDRELDLVRRRAFAVAYRMLGSVADAEDVVQEAMLRLTRAGAGVQEPTAWITTVATRLSIDLLRLARVRREAYIGPWLPEPLIEDAQPDASARLELSDSLSQAFLVVLERLTPVERAAFLLREVFDYEYPQIARIVNRSEPNCRQLVARARKHIASERTRFDADAALRDRLLERFLAAAEHGDLESLERMLAEDAVLYADGGGKIAAARHPLHGAARIARVIAAITRKQRRHGPFDLEVVRVNGQPGRILRTPDGNVWDVLSIEVLDGRIQAIRIVRNPEKLGRLRPIA